MTFAALSPPLLLAPGVKVPMTVRSLLDAAMNDLVQLINRFDLEVTPGSVKSDDMEPHSQTHCPDLVRLTHAWRERRRQV